MEDSLKKFLLSVDDVEECEAPKTFDVIKEMKKVKKIKSQIEKIIGCNLELDEWVQDASFFTELHIIEESQKERKGKMESYVGLYNLSVRFSSFGNMVTMFSNNGVDIYNTYPINEIVALLEDNKYVFIRAESLDEPYDGMNKYITDKDTWWIRYFDYI